MCDHWFAMKYDIKEEEDRGSLETATAESYSITVNISSIWIIDIDITMSNVFTCCKSAGA